MFGGRKESRGRNERAEAAPAQDRHPRKPLAKALGTQSLWSQTSEHTPALVTLSIYLIVASFPGTFPWLT